MEKSRHTQPGYTLLYFPNKEVKSSMFSFPKYAANGLNIDYGEAKYISQTQETSGPAVISVNKYESTHIFSKGSLLTDNIDALHCKTWPVEARHWSNHTQWPNTEMQANIKSEGFLLIKKGHPKSPEKDEEYRLSFSMAEKHLVRSFNPTQMKCYVVLKLLLYVYIKPEVPDAISSYHLKTLMFWSIETGNYVWEPEHFLECLEQLLHTLLIWVETKNCRNYFIPENNMFSSKVTDENKSIVYDLINGIKNSLWEKCCNLLECGFKESFPFLLYNNTVEKLQIKSVRQTLWLIRIFKFDISYRLYSSANIHVSFLMRHYKLDPKRLLDYVLFHEKHFPTFSECPTEKKVLTKLCEYVLAWIGSIFKSLTFREKLQRKAVHQQGAIFLEKYQNKTASTGCIKMAMVKIVEGNVIKAAKLLETKILSWKRFESNLQQCLPTLYFNFPESYCNPDTMKCFHCSDSLDSSILKDKDSLKEYMLSEFLSNKYAEDVPFVWLENDILPRLLQFEITELLLCDTTNNMQYITWHPLQLAYLLLFHCAAASQTDHSRQQKALEKLIECGVLVQPFCVDSVLNMLSWCYMELNMFKEAINFAIVTVQTAGDRKKTLFSHYLISAIITVILSSDFNNM